jgi:hypothetical protein
MRDRRKACRKAVRRTGFCVSWPDLGLCPSFVGGHFFVLLGTGADATQQGKNPPPGLDPIRYLAMMNLAPRVF